MQRPRGMNSTVCSEGVRRLLAGRAGCGAGLRGGNPSSATSGGSFSLSELRSHRPQHDGPCAWLAGGRSSAIVFTKHRHTVNIGMCWLSLLRK